MVSNLVGGLIMAAISIVIAIIGTIFYCIYLRTEEDLQPLNDPPKEEIHEETTTGVGIDGNPDSEALAA